MRPFIPLSTAAQVAAHLREEILRGGLRDELPGYRRLAERLGVNHKTMRAALVLLEEDGLLVPQGSGRCCRVLLEERLTPTGFRVSILPFEDDDRLVAYHRDIIDRLEQAGHVASFAEKTLSDLHFDVSRLARFVSKHPADAWVVIAGTRDVLEWFAGQPIPVFALAGRSAGLADRGCHDSEVARHRQGGVPTGGSRSPADRHAGARGPAQALSREGRNRPSWTHWRRWESRRGPTICPTGRTPSRISIAASTRSSGALHPRPCWSTRHRFSSPRSSSSPSGAWPRRGMSRCSVSIRTPASTGAARHRTHPLAIPAARVADRPLGRQRRTRRGRPSQYIHQGGVRRRGNHRACAGLMGFPWKRWGISGSLDFLRLVHPEVHGSLSPVRPGVVGNGGESDLITILSPTLGLDGGHSTQQIGVMAGC